MWCKRISELPVAPMVMSIKLKRNFRLWICKLINDMFIVFCFSFISSNIDIWSAVISNSLFYFVLLRRYLNDCNLISWLLLFLDSTNIILIYFIFFFPKLLFSKSLWLQHHVSSKTFTIHFLVSIFLFLMPYSENTVLFFSSIVWRIILFIFFVFERREGFFYNLIHVSPYVHYINYPNVVFLFMLRIMK